MTTPLPPGPTFNRESVDVHSTDGPAVATPPLPRATAGSPIPPGYKLVRISLLEQLHDQIIQIKRERDELQRLRDVPAFLRSPAPTFPEIRTRA